TASPYTAVIRVDHKVILTNLAQGDTAACKFYRYLFLGLVDDFHPQSGIGAGVVVEVHIGGHFQGGVPVIVHGHHQPGGHRNQEGNQPVPEVLVNMHQEQPVLDSFPVNLFHFSSSRAEECFSGQEIPPWESALSPAYCTASADPAGASARPPGSW